jgi:hypothetical protein
MMRIAIIDPQFDRHADIQATEAGAGVEFQILRPDTK